MVERLHTSISFCIRWPSIVLSAMRLSLRWLYCTPSASSVFSISSGSCLTSGAAVEMHA